jgi:hypothetical protein
MSDQKKSTSKTNLNESALPLLDSDPDKGETPEKEEKIELETKGAGDNAEKATEDKPEKAGWFGKRKIKEKKEKVPKPVKEPKEKKPLTTPLEHAQNFTAGLNIHDRDEQKINEQVNLNFEDILGETDANQGFEFIWRLTFLIFNFTKFWLYRVLAALLAIPLAILWAVVFALLSVTSVWFCTPLLKIFDLLLFHVHKVWSGLIRTVLGPFFEVGGLLFANIRTKHESANVVAA